MKLVSKFLVLTGFLLILSGCATTGMETETSRKHLQAGLKHEDSGDYQQAIEHYTKAAKSGYHDEAYVYLGNTYQRMGAFGQAEKYYRIALEKLPGHADLHHNLAYLYLKEEVHLAEAEKLVLRAIELNDESDHANRYRSTLKKIRELKPGKKNVR